MASIPLYQLGKHLVAITITPQNVSTAGVLSDGTPISCVATRRSMGLDFQPEKSEINHGGSTRHNNVVLADGYSYNIEVLKVNNGNDPAPLKTAYLAYDIFKVSWTEGTGTSQKVNTIYGSRGAAGDRYDGRGEVIFTFAIDCVDVGASDFYTLT